MQSIRGTSCVGAEITRRHSSATRARIAMGLAYIFDVEWGDILLSESCNQTSGGGMGNVCRWVGG